MSRLDIDFILSHILVGGAEGKASVSFVYIWWMVVEDGSSGGGGDSGSSGGCGSSSGCGSSGENLSWTH